MKTKRQRGKISLEEYEKELSTHDFNFVMIQEMNAYKNSDIPIKQLIEHERKEEQLVDWAMTTPTHYQLFEAWVNYITRGGFKPLIETVIINGNFTQVVIGHIGHEGENVQDGTIHDWRKLHVRV